MLKALNITPYIFCHTNFSQVEHTAPFIERAEHAKIFVYDGFNTEHDKMVAYYKQMDKVDVFTFSVETIINELEKEKGYVVFLMTASTNFGFGLGQKNCLTILQKIFPKVVDVCCLGHCMYGCQSCGLAEHNIPLFFTRYFNKTLPLTATQIEEKYFKKGMKKCIICPTVGEESFLSDPEMTLKIAKTCEKLQNDGRYSFVVKLHSFCQLADQAKKHALFSISDKERESVKILSERLQIAEEIDYNILPYMECADVLISDLSSSVTFESLYFNDLTVYSFYNEEVEKADKEFTSLFFSFKNEQELANLLENNVRADNGEKKKEFFKKKYGVVDGKEVERYITFRKWNEKIQAISVINAPTPCFEKAVALFQEQEATVVDTVLDKLAFGLPITQEDVEYTNFTVLHQQQLEPVPKALRRVLFRKLQSDVFDVMSSVQLAHVVSSPDEDPLAAPIRVLATRDIPKESDIFLIDHAWTLLPEMIHPQLESSPELRARVAAMFCVAPEGVEKTIWSHLGRYRVRGPDGEQVAYYLMDEFGTCLDHAREQDVHNPSTPNGATAANAKSEGEPEKGPQTEAEDSPQEDYANVKVVLFIRADNGQAYSIWWPIRDIADGEILKRDYASGTKDELEREIALADTPFAEREPINTEQLFAAFSRYRDALKTSALVLKGENTSIFTDEIQPSLIPKGAKIKVYTDLEMVCKYLTRKEFEVQDMETAFKKKDEIDKGEIGEDSDGYSVFFFECEDFKTAKGLKENMSISQYENETCLCFKHYLSKLVDNYYGTDGREFLPLAYDFETSKSDFVAHYLLNANGTPTDPRYHMEKSVNPKNTWIVKPCNLSRGLEICVSNDLVEILKRAGNDPRIACQYVERPLLFEGRKFDIRYIVLSRCSPLPEVVVYKTFWLRFANNQYQLGDFGNYETHFTVMNYGHKMTHIRDYEFVPRFNEMYKPVKWEELEKKLFGVLTKTFKAAFLTPQTSEPKGIVIDRHCVSLWGADMMLDEQFNPYLIEMNFSPDCTRACDYDAEFYNKVFGYLYFGESEFVTKIL